MRVVGLDGYDADSIGHILSLFIQGIKRSQRLLFKGIDVQQVIELAKHGAVFHIMSMDDHIFILGQYRAGNIQKGCAGSAFSAIKIMVDIEKVIALGNGKIDLLHAFQF